MQEFQQLLSKFSDNPFRISGIKQRRQARLKNRQKITRIQKSALVLERKIPLFEIRIFFLSETFY